MREGYRVLDELFQGRECLLDFVGPFLDARSLKFMIVYSYLIHNPKIKSLKNAYAAYKLNKKSNSETPEAATLGLFRMCKGCPVGMFEYLGDWISRSLDPVTTAVLENYNDIRYGMVTRDAQYINKSLSALELHGIQIDKRISTRILEKDGKLTGEPVPDAVGVEWKGGPIVTKYDKLDAGMALINRADKTVYIYDADPSETLLVEEIEKLGGVAIEIQYLHELMGV